MNTQTLNGYLLESDEWRVSGGSGQCNTGIKNGERYFIKRLTYPKYPASEHFKGEFKKKKIRECEEWLATRKKVSSSIPGSGTGNIVKPLDYFRDGACYYEVTRYVDDAGIPCEAIYKESVDDKINIMLSVSRSLADIHKKGVVHGDIDPGNIIITRTAGRGKLTTRLIDFTDAFFEKNPPESIMSKDFWWSPEVALYSKASGGEDRDLDNPYAEYITCKADVFSLGVVFHQYCAKGGKAPITDKDQPWQEFQLGRKLHIDSSIEPIFRPLIAAMLECEPSKRLSMEEVYQKLSEIKKTRMHSMSMIKTGISAPGSKVVTIRYHERNPKKVVIGYADGHEQIMDYKLAEVKGYIS